MKTNGNNKAVAVMTDVRFIVFIIGIVLGVVFWVQSPDTQMRESLIKLQADVTTIKTNELPHIQSAVTENKLDVDKLQDCITQIKESIARIEALLEK